MSLSLGEIAGRYGCELHGDPDFIVEHVATLMSAGEKAISFLANPAYRPQLEATRAGGVILSPEDCESCPTSALVTSNPYAVYARVAAELHPATGIVAGVDPSASVSSSAVLPETSQVEAGAVIEAGAVVGERAYIGPNSVVGAGTRLGDDTRIMAGVMIYPEMRIGRRCILHSGVVIGADGFGIARDEAGWVKVPQVGRVVIGDDVEIGANSTVDRGAIDDTVIEDGVKIDNQVQIAHNVRIGAHTAMAALTGVSGSTTIGAGCLIGGASIVAGHISICDGVMLAAGSGVANSIKSPGAYGGFPANADEIGNWRKNVVRYGQLDDMARRLRRLEKRLEKQQTEE